MAASDHRVRLLLNLLPFVSWPRPTVGQLRRDAMAGLTVGLVLIPQALAYAALAGMPPVTGLYAGLLPSVVGALWGSSSLLAVGPVALTSLLTFAALQPLAVPGSAEWVSLAIWLALYSGLVQFVLGILRLGIIANFVSNAVIAGFINAAALIILVSQLPALVGLPADIGSQWPADVAQRLEEAPLLVLATAVFGIGALAVLLLQRKLIPRIPGVLVVAVAGLAASAAAGFADAGGAVVGAVPSGLPALGWPPTLTFAQHRALIPAAAIIALISFTEAMASCRTLARQRNEAWNKDQELVGQGLAKLASGISGAFPVSGSFSRSALNAYVGAQSSYSTLFAAACLLACLLWFTDYLSYLPHAVLAAIIIVPVLGLINLRVFRTLWQTSRHDGIVAVATFASTLLSVPNLYWGVFAGFALSLVLFVVRRARPRIIELGLHDAGTLRDRASHTLPPVAPGVLAVRMDASLVYITAPILERFIRERLRKDPELHAVLLCASPVNEIDSTGIDILRQLHDELRQSGKRLYLSGVKKQVRDVMARAGLLRIFGEDALFPNNRDAIKYFAEHPQVPRWSEREVAS